MWWYNVFMEEEVKFLETILINVVCVKIMGFVFKH